MDPIARIRPMTIGDMFDAAFRLYRAHFLTFVGIVALLQVPMAIVQFLLQVTIGNSALASLMRFSSGAARLRPGQNIFDVLPVGQLLTFYAITLGVAALQYLVVQNLISGALANAISRTYLGQPIAILSAYGFGSRRYLALIVASLAPLLLGGLVFVLLMGCGFGAAAALGVAAQRGRTGVLTGVLIALLLAGTVVLLVVAMLLFLVRFLLVTQAIVLEDRGPLDGLGRSWRLVGGSFWRTVGIVILMGILTYLISAVPASVASFALTLGSGGSLNALVRNQVITTLLAQIGLILALPLQLSVYTLLYYDLRVRKEGYDLELLAQQAALS